MISEYKRACMAITNDPQLPARIVDWADELYMNFDGYRNGKREYGITVNIEDLALLEQVLRDLDNQYDQVLRDLDNQYDDGYAIHLIDIALSRRS